MHKRDHLERYIAIGGFFVIIMLIFVSRLVTIQIAGQDYYTEVMTEKTYTRTEPIQAQRGEIFDRNGNLLVGNEYSYSLYLDAASIPRDNSERNKLLLELYKTAKEFGELDGYEAPSDPFVEIGGEWEFDEEYMETVYGKRLIKLLSDLHYVQGEDGEWTFTDTSEKVHESSLGDAREALRLRYGIIDADGNSLYGSSDDKFLFALRLDMELKYFSTAEPYTFISDVDIKYIIAVSEGGRRGYNISCDAKRVYMYPGYMSHMLGRVGKIYAENVEYYTNLGYSLNAIVGTSGVESAFEQYLHGQDGVMAIVEDEYGNVVDKYVMTEPTPGKDVYLTVDINLQMAAENALKNNIDLIVENALGKEGELDGEDADAGAVSALNRKTGEVLALASYPTYNLVTFNEDYASLLENEAAPLFNRALEGTYPPGSTFKIGVSLAALQEGVISPYTEIRDLGKYEYYADFQPECWIYAPKYGRQTHGSINVHQAIQVSCNYFFYDIGRQLTISNITKYAAAFGIGEKTGIELNEKTGVLAGPAYRESRGETWYDGDTLQAAIGQSDTLVTPLQLSNYIASVLNGGNRNSVHILYEVRDYLGNVVYKPETEVIETIELEAGNVSVVKNAMKDMVENGSAARVFVDYAIPVGGKTGTAQVSETGSDNALFTAFAPFDDPEIVCSCIIEHGANGTDAGYAVRDIFSFYFGLTQDTGADNGTDDGTNNGGADDGANQNDA